LDITNSKPVPENTDTPGSERRRARRKKSSSLGRLAYGGNEPRVLSCEIFDMSETGVRVETYAPPSLVPEFVTLEIGGIYHRARRCWIKGHQIGLELIPDEV
jgi:hypothetical protein